MLMDFYAQGRAERRLREGHRDGPAAHPVEPAVRVPLRARPGRRSPGKALSRSATSSSRRGSRSSSGAASPTTSCSSSPSRNRLSRPAVLAQQVRRMLADPRSTALTENFAGQWLYLRNLEIKDASTSSSSRTSTTTCATPSARETELLFEHIVREDRSVLELLTADYTFVDERLAKHYGMPGVYGSEFRRVPVANDAPPGLARPRQHPARHVATRTHVARATRRLGAREHRRRAPCRRRRRSTSRRSRKPPATKTSTRVRCASRWSCTARKPFCAGCHKIMDPVGLAMENFDVDRPLAHRGARHADRRDGAARRRHADRRSRRAARRAAEIRRAVRAQRDREAPDLRARPRHSSTTTCPSFARSCATRPRRLPVLVASCSGSSTSDAFQMRATEKPRRRPLVVGGSCTSSGPRGADTMFITKKHLPRRTFLRGIGATIALPLLDAMVPAGTALANTAAKPQTRYSVRARAARRDHGPVHAEGRRQELRAVTPILEPFAPYQSHMTVISNPDHRMATSQSPEEARRRPRSHGIGVLERRARRSAPKARTSTPASRSTRCSRARSARKARCRRSRCASRTSARSAFAASATAAPTRTRSRGRRRPRRCRWSATRRSCSSGCSATAARPRSARARQTQDAAFSTPSLAERVVAEARLGRERPRALRRLPATTSARSSAASRSRRSARRRRLASGRRSRSCRSTSTSKLMLDLQIMAFKTDVTRIATMMLSRDSERRGVPRERRARRLPRDLAPPGESDAHGALREAQRLPHVDRRAISSTS